VTQALERARARAERAHRVATFTGEIKSFACDDD
jgi:hypothetical protein